MPRVKFKRIKNKDYVGLLDQAVNRTVDASAGQGQRLAAFLTAVDTGRLRAGNKKGRTANGKGSYFNDVEYAQFVEPKQPFLIPSAIRLAKLIAGLAKVLFRSTYGR